MDRSTTQLTSNKHSNKHSKKLNDLNEMTISMKSQLQKDTQKLEDSYFRGGELNKELGFSSALLSDIGRAKKKTKINLVCYFAFNDHFGILFPIFQNKTFQYVAFKDLSRTNKTC